MTIEEKYQELLKTPSDVNLCFPMIRESVEEGDTVVELGVRNCVSTWALLAAKPKRLISVDVNFPPKENLIEVGKAAEAAGIDFFFVHEDSTTVVFDSIDVLFVDTLHLYSHIVKELWRHAEQVKKRIIFHDTRIPEVKSCIQDFLFNTNWIMENETSECNGLAVVKRISRPYEQRQN